MLLQHIVSSSAQLKERRTLWVEHNHDQWKLFRTNPFGTLQQFLQICVREITWIQFITNTLSGCTRTKSWNFLNLFTWTGIVFFCNCTNVTCGGSKISNETRSTWVMSLSLQCNYGVKAISWQMHSLRCTSSRIIRCFNNLLVQAFDKLICLWH